MAMMKKDLKIKCLQAQNHMIRVLLVEDDRTDAYEYRSCCRKPECGSMCVMQTRFSSAL